MKQESNTNYDLELAAQAAQITQEHERLTARVKQQNATLAALMQILLQEFNKLVLVEDEQEKLSSEKKEINLQNAAQASNKTVETEKLKALETGLQALDLTDSVDLESTKQAMLTALANYRAIRVSSETDREGAAAGVYAAESGPNLLSEAEDNSDEKNQKSIKACDISTLTH